MVNEDRKMNESYMKNENHEMKKHERSRYHIKLETKKYEKIFKLFSAKYICFNWKKITVKIKWIIRREIVKKFKIKKMHVRLKKIWIKNSN